MLQRKAVDGLGVFTALGRPSVCRSLVKNPWQSPTSSTACLWVLNVTSRFTSLLPAHGEGMCRERAPIRLSVRPGGNRSPKAELGSALSPLRGWSGGGEGAQPHPGVSALWVGHISTAWEWGMPAEGGDGEMDGGDRRTATVPDPKAMPISNGGRRGGHCPSFPAPNHPQFHPHIPTQRSAAPWDPLAPTQREHRAHSLTPQGWDLGRG